MNYLVNIIKKFTTIDCFSIFENNIFQELNQVLNIILLPFLYSYILL